MCGIILILKSYPSNSQVSFSLISLETMVNILYINYHWKTISLLCMCILLKSCFFDIIRDKSFFENRLNKSQINLKTNGCYYHYYENGKLFNPIFIYDDGSTALTNVRLRSSFYLEKYIKEWNGKEPKAFGLFWGEFTVVKDSIIFRVFRRMDFSYRIYAPVEYRGKVLSDTSFQLTEYITTPFKSKKRRKNTTELSDVYYFQKGGYKPDSMNWLKRRKHYTPKNGARMTE